MYSFWPFFHGSGSDPNFFADPDPGKKSAPDPDKRTRILNPVKEANTETFFHTKVVIFQVLWSRHSFYQLVDYLSISNYYGIVCFILPVFN